MGRIGNGHVVAARAKVAAMDLATKERLVDEVYCHQPHLLAAVLALHASEVSMTELDRVLHILLVCYQAMIESGEHWPVIMPEDQEKHGVRLSAQIKFQDDLEPISQRRAIADFIDTHPEKSLLAFVFDEIGTAAWSNICTDKEQQLVIVALNIVECISHADNSINKR